MSTEIGPLVPPAAPADAGLVVVDGAAACGGGANVSGTPAELTRAGPGATVGVAKGEKDEILIEAL